MVGGQVKGCVLLVDDETAARDSYARLLDRAGFEVVTAADGAEALQRMEKGQFDLVISDISMPEMDGLSLLQSMRTRSMDMPVVLMLDKRNKRTSVEAGKLGVRECLVKPIPPKALTSAASEAVRLYRSQRKKLPAVSQIDATPFTATAAKNDFARLLEIAIRGGRAVITKHDTPKAVLISFDEFKAFTTAGAAKLETLSGEFDALLSRMQTAKARAGMKAAFNASPKQLGKAASAAARKRG